MSAAETRARAGPRTKCAGNVVAPCFRCQPRLRLCDTRTHEHVVPHWNLPRMSERVRKACALIEPTFALTCPCQWNGYERGTFPDDIVWPGETCHGHSHWFGERLPPAVLELMYKRGTGPAVDPADGAPATDVRRKQVAPCASASTSGMTAPLTSWGRQRHNTVPAPRAREAAIPMIVDAGTHDACAWQKEVQRNLRPPAPCTDVPDHVRAAVLSAARMTSRGAAMPNHHSNASAPCSSSMHSPSAAA
jgi:hypothetical protein